MFSGFGGMARVSAPDWVDLADLTPWMAPEVVGAPGADGPADVALAPSARGYRVMLGERWFGPYDDPDKTLRGLASGIHYVIGRRSPMTFIHAGAVEVDGSALVFPGASGYGKSTLVTRLVDEGCGYLSDEWAVLSSEGTVFPLSKPIRLRGTTSDSYVRPRGVSTPGGFSCAAFVFTRFRPAARWDPQPITPGQAVLRAIPSTVRCSAAPDQTLEALTRATRRAVCVRSRRGEDGEPSTATLRELLASRTQSRERSSNPRSNTSTVSPRRTKEAVR